MNSVQHVLVLLLSAVEAGTTLLRESINNELVKPWDVQIRDSEYLHIGLVMAGVSPEEHPEQHYLHRMEKMLTSALSYSQGTPLHLIFLTDKKSIPVISSRVETTMAQVLIGRILLHSEVWKTKRYKIPKMRIEFVDFQAVTNKYKHTVDHMKKHFNRHNESYVIGGESIQSHINIRDHLSFDRE